MGYYHLLTIRERQVALVVSEGASNKQVGRRLGITEGTVKIHLHNIYRKLAVANRTALAVVAVPVGNLQSEILVVQTAQNGYRQRAADSLDGTRDRGVLVQR